MDTIGKKIKNRIEEYLRTEYGLLGDLSKKYIAIYFQPKNDLVNLLCQKDKEHLLVSSFEPTTSLNDLQNKILEEFKYQIKSGSIDLSDYGLDNTIDLENDSEAILEAIKKSGITLIQIEEIENFINVNNQQQELNLEELDETFNSLQSSSQGGQ